MGCQRHRCAVRFRDGRPGSHAVPVPCVVVMMLRFGLKLVSGISIRVRDAVNLMVGSTPPYHNHQHTLSQTIIASNQRRRFSQRYSQMKHGHVSRGTANICVDICCRYVRCQLKIFCPFSPLRQKHKCVAPLPKFENFDSELYPKYAKFVHSEPLCLSSLIQSGQARSSPIKCIDGFNFNVQCVQLTQIGRPFNGPRCSFLLFQLFLSRKHRSAMLCVVHCVPDALVPRALVATPNLRPNISL